MYEGTVFLSVFSEGLLTDFPSKDFLRFFEILSMGKLSIEIHRKSAENTQKIQKSHRKSEENSENPKKI